VWPREREKERERKMEREREKERERERACTRKHTPHVPTTPPHKKTQTQQAKIFQLFGEGS